MLDLLWRSLLTGFLAALTALGLAWFVGCSSASQKRVEMSTKVAEYAWALDHCFADAVTYPAYEQCAQEVDKKFGRVP